MALERLLFAPKFLCIPAASKILFILPRPPAEFRTIVDIQCPILEKLQRFIYSNSALFVQDIQSSHASVQYSI